MIGNCSETRNSLSFEDLLPWETDFIQIHIKTFLNPIHAWQENYFINSEYDGA